jgi:hypothetical protein
MHVLKARTIFSRELEIIWKEVMATAFSPSSYLDCCGTPALSIGLTVSLAAEYFVGIFKCGVFVCPETQRKGSGDVVDRPVSR